MVTSKPEALRDKQLAAAARYNVTKWADILRLSPRTLRHYCKLLFRCPPETLLQNYRLEASKPLLLAHLPVKLVAAKLWYKHVSLFCRHFKAHFHLTPSQFVAHHEATGALAATDNTLPLQITH